MSKQFIGNRLKLSTYSYRFPNNQDCHEMWSKERKKAKSETQPKALASSTVSKTTTTKSTAETVRKAKPKPLPTTSSVTTAVTAKIQTNYIKTGGPLDELLPPPPPLPSFTPTTQTKTVSTIATNTTTSNTITQNSVAKNSVGSTISNTATNHVAKAVPPIVTNKPIGSRRTSGIKSDIQLNHYTSQPINLLNKTSSNSYKQWPT